MLDDFADYRKRKSIPLFLFCNLLVHKALQRNLKPGIEEKRKLCWAVRCFMLIFLAIISYGKSLLYR